ncbi:MAG: AAA family ATPase [Gemmatales bacterium]|nr:AAA family ATPase [Gemmatales bacterium]MDW8174324.1 AAA family ATPase [Gemmatales bacterium]
MDLPKLLQALTEVRAYPFPVDKVEVRQTHISMVFLAGPVAYKIKKPVCFSFVDFSTLEKRRYYCEREIQLNRRLAPQVYHGVVPITQTEGGIAVEGQGPVVEWAVKMNRLPDEATLEWRVQHGQLQPATLVQVAERLAGFHRHAERNAEIAAHATAERVAELAYGNLDIARQQVGLTITACVYQRLLELTKSRWAELRDLFEDRARRLVPCDTHGDLRLEHIYLLPEYSPPHDITIIDCVEFNDAFRYADPVADMAFVVMDLLYENRRDLAQVFADSYFQASGDEEGRKLLSWYVAYRAGVRGKVRSLLAEEAEVAAEYRQRARAEARRYWLLALQALEIPARRPVVILVAGLPGVGKSTVARWLAEHAHCLWLRSDHIRKELAGLQAHDQAATGFAQGIYSPEWTERTYAEMVRRADSALAEGRRVVVDATFSAEAHRQLFLDLASRWAVPLLVLLCQADTDTVRQRLSQRRNDASDADWFVYQQVAQRWQPLTPSLQRQSFILNTARRLVEVHEELHQLLRTLSLL